MSAKTVAAPRRSPNHLPLFVLLALIGFALYSCAGGGSSSERDWGGQNGESGMDARVMHGH